MTELLAFYVRGDTFYRKDAIVPLNQNRLSLFVGNNLDGNVPSGLLSNGSGKTRLIQLLQSFIYGSCDRGSLKSIVTSDFHGTLELKNEHVWSFTFDMKENRWTVIKDGKLHFESHKPSECQELLQRQIGLSKKEWSNYVHISGKSITTLLEGKPAERRKYLESFFNIDDFYASKKIEYDAKLDANSKELEQLRVQQGQLDQLEQLLKDQESESFLKMQLEVIADSVSVLKDHSATLMKTSSAMEKDLNAWVEYQELYDQVDGKPKLKALRTSHASVSQRLAELREAEKKKITVERFVRTELDPAKRSLVDLPSEPTSTRPDSQDLMRRESDLLKMRQKIKLKAKIADLTDSLPDISAIRHTEEKLAEISTSLREHLAEVKHHAGLLKEGDVCQNCGQTLEFILNNSSTEDRAKELADEQTEIEQQLKAFDGQSRLLRLHREVSARIEDARKDFGSYPVFGVKVSVAEQELAELKSANEAWASWIELRDEQRDAQSTYDAKLAQATGMGYPEVLAIDNAGDITAQSALLRELNADISLQEHFERATAKVHSLDLRSKIEESLKALRSESVEIQTNLDSLLALSGQYSAALQSVVGWLASHAKLAAGLAKKPDLEVESAVLSGMAKFYSPKGFMLYELKRRCQSLIDKANFWSPIFFQEQYEWSLSPEMEDLDFLVRPTKHPATEPYPVAMLSSGEENRAARVLLFSQLQIIPPNKKMNVLFLDEVERNLDKAGMLAFTETVIPKLKETFPERSIVIISHEPSLQNSPHFDSLWLAERKDRLTSFTAIDGFNKK